MERFSVMSAIVQPGFQHQFCEPGGKPSEEIRRNLVYFLSMGWPVLPLHSRRSEGGCTCGKIDCRSLAKHPLVAHGVKDASRDRQQIFDWWSRFPFANVGIATGGSSGLMVIDIDKKSGGFESLARLESEIPEIRQTLEVKSGGGGRHLYFRYPGFPVRSSVGILPGIDIRSDGAYIVAPPSVHQSGLSYEFEVPNQEIAPLPQKFFSYLERKPALSIIPKSDLGPSRSSNLANGIEPGVRHDTMMSVGGFLRSKGMTQEQIEPMLFLMNEKMCNPPLGKDEIQGMVRSLSSYKALVWEELKPLPKNESKLHSLTPTLLPTALRPWIADCRERLQVPLEFIAGPAIVACATIIGRKVMVAPMQRDKSWKLPANLWGALIAEPGSLKSPSIAAAMAPLEKLAKEAHKEYSKGGKSGVEKRYKTNDPTAEKLALLMRDNPQGLLLLRDELSGWLESFERAGREGSREFYLEAWNGNGSYSIDRIGSGTTHVDSLCLSIFGGIQPDKLKAYIDRTCSGFGDDGFLSRFQILFYPNKPEGWKLTDRTEDRLAHEDAEKLIHKLNDFSYDEASPLVLNFSPAAQVLADDWRTNLEERLLVSHPSAIIQGHLSKYRSLMPKLALILELCEGSPFEVQSISEASVLKAISWCQILESHLSKIYQGTVEDQCSPSTKLAQKIELGLIQDGDKLRDIMRRNWQGLKTSEHLAKAIEPLTAIGWAQIETKTARGGSSDAIRLNPRLESFLRQGV